MVLAIKLTDNIFVPQSIIDSGKHLLGLNYTLAQNKIKGLYTTSEESKFNRFFTDIQTHIKPALMFNLYHLVDSLSISELLIANNLHNNDVRASDPNPLPELLLPIENYLNYLGFEVDKIPNENQLVILNILKKIGIISEYWLEGETRQIISSRDVENKDVFGDKVGVGFPSIIQNEFNAIQPINAGNTDILEENYLRNLDFKKHENRGAGATIIIIESNATDDLKKIGNKVNISHFEKHRNAFNSFGEMSEGNIHQLKTLITLYGNRDKQIQGLVPQANLVVCSLRNIEGFEPNSFLNRKNDLLSLLRECLFKTLNQDIKNAILLLEFESIIPLGDKFELTSEYFPSYIIYDIYKRLEEITTQQNTIVVGGVGNSSKNFNDLDPFPWKLEKPKGLLKELRKKGFTYIDLTQRNLPFIMVSAVDKKVGDTDFTIEKESNYGKEVDIFMYTNFPMGSDIENFDGTSAASAATAGIIAFLQGRALSIISLLPENPNFQNVKPLTTQIIKRVFENTFMLEFQRNIQTPLISEKTGFIHKTSFIELWEECEKQLKTLQHQ